MHTDSINMNKVQSIYNILSTFIKCKQPQLKISANTRGIIMYVDNTELI